MSHRDPQVNKPLLPKLLLECLPASLLLALEQCQAPEIEELRLYSNRYARVWYEKKLPHPSSSLTRSDLGDPKTNVRRLALRLSPKHSTRLFSVGGRHTRWRMRKSGGRKRTGHRCHGDQQSYHPHPTSGKRISRTNPGLPASNRFFKGRFDLLSARSWKNNAFTRTCRKGSIRKLCVANGSG